MMIESVIRLLPFLTMTALLILVPYTKVEESFNMQATHDLLFLSKQQTESRIVSGAVDDGVASPTLLDFDHHVYPGVVPRTFSGPLYLAGLSYPVLGFLSVTGLDNVILPWVDFHGLHYPTIDSTKSSGGGVVLQDVFLAQIVARWVLGCTVCAAFNFLANSLTVATGKSLASSCLLLMMGTQFHLMFYASRMLPNTFAMALVAVAMGLVLRARFYSGLAVLGVAASVFRSDVLVLVAPLAALLLGSKRIDFFLGLSAGVLAIVCALALTVPLDSFFWRCAVWPEGAVFWFNTADNKSSEWGTSPWPWYFYSVVPKALFAFLPFLPFSLVLGSPRIVRTTTSAAILFLILYSFLPHKELRFVLMVFPLLFCPIASWFSGMAGLNAKLVFLLCVGVNAVFAGLLAVASLDNYPGGVAIAKVNRLIQQDQQFQLQQKLLQTTPTQQVHLDAYAGMSGVTRFLKLRGGAEQQQLGLGGGGPGGFGGRGGGIGRGGGTASLNNRKLVTYSKDPSVFNSTGQGIYTRPVGAAEPPSLDGKRRAVKNPLTGSVQAVAGLSASTIPSGSTIPKVPSAVYHEHSTSTFHYLVTRYTDKGWHLDQGYYEHLEDISCFTRVDYARFKILKEPFLSIFKLKLSQEQKKATTAATTATGADK